MERYEKANREDLVRWLVRAEQTLHAETEDEKRRRLYELELHRIELELSNRELAATQAELEASRDQFATLFELAPVAYLKLDRRGIITHSNLAAARLLGRERAALEGRPIASLLDATNRSSWVSHLKAVLANDGLVSHEFELTGLEGDALRALRFDSCVTAPGKGEDGCLTTITDITELRSTQRQLDRRNQELSSLLAAAPVGIGIVRERVLQSVSPYLLKLLGFSEEQLVGQSSRILYRDAAEFERVGRIKYAQVRAQGVGEIETVMRRRDGVLLEVLLRSAALDPDDLTAGLVLTVLDVTDRKRAERQREDTQRLLDLALEGGDIGTYSGMLPEGPCKVDGRYLAMLGYRPGELTLDWQAWRAMIHPDDRAEVEARAAPVLQGEADSFEAEYRMRHRLGHWVWVLDRARVHERSVDSATAQTAGTHMDITRRREAEGQVIYLVEHDAATNVLNRRGIMRSIKTILGQAERTGRPFALAILDLDLFKEINDAYGHLAGDVVLRRVAKILTHEVRSADWVGRWGGDEFILVLPDSSAATAMATVERVRERVGADSINAEGHELRPSLTAGLALFRPGTDSLQALIQRADAALYRAKRQGRNRAVFDGAEEGQAAISIAAMLQEALRTGSVDVCERPLRDLRSNRHSADELVGRVRHPSHGLLDEVACIDVAEQLGLMHRIDHSVLEAVVQRLVAASSDDQTEAHRPVFVRLSRDSLTHASNVRALMEVLASMPSAATVSSLVLTVNEAHCKQGAKPVLAALRPLLDQGCKLGIDGFGGPQSTTRFLVDLPTAFLFVDAEMLRLATGSSRARAALVGITQTAHELGCTTIARCGGDDALLEWMSALGIDWVQ